jgi:parvulin-like peptidyl-prolyl isomerase
MVTHELALQDAKGHEPADLEAQVKKQSEEAQQQLGGAAAFDKALAEMGLTSAEFTKRLREDLIVRDRIRQAVENSTNVTPAEVRAFYDEKRDQMKTPERVRASHILIAVPKDASDVEKKEKRRQIEDAQAKLKSGESFTTLAGKISEDPISARMGGDLGYFARGQMVPEFELVAFSLKTNEVSEIVVTKFGYHILLVTDHQAAGERTFDEVKADLTRYLSGQKGQEAAQAYAKKLQASGKSEILLAKPTPPAPPMGAGTSVVTPPATAKPAATVETKPVAAPPK